VIAADDFEIPVTAGRVDRKEIAIHYGFGIYETALE